MLAVEAQADVVERLLTQYRFGEWAARRGIEQDCRCIYCGGDLLASYSEYNSWQFDHIYPLSHGGEESFENVVVCCRSCNYLKLNYAPTGATREERIMDARRYVMERRAVMETEIAEVRLLIRGASAAPADVTSNF